MVGQAEELKAGFKLAGINVQGANLESIMKALARTSSPDGHASHVHAPPANRHCQRMPGIFF